MLDAAGNLSPKPRTATAFRTAYQVELTLGLTCTATTGYSIRPQHLARGGWPQSMISARWMRPATRSPPSGRQQPDSVMRPHVGCLAVQGVRHTHGEDFLHGILGFAWR